MNTKFIFRILLFWMIFLAMLMISGVVASIFFPRIKEGYGILGSLSALVLSYFAARLEHKSLCDFDLIPDQKTIFRLALGLVAGALIFAIVFFFIICFAKVSVTGSGAGFEVLQSYLIYFPLALMEEIGFRAITFRKLTERYGLVASQFITAVAFGLYHIANGWDPIVAFTGPFTWSFVFGLAAYRSKGIAAAVGVHAMINILQTAVGFKHGAGLLILSYSDADALNTMGLIAQGLLFVVALGITMRLGTLEKKERINS